MGSDSGNITGLIDYRKIRKLWAYLQRHGALAAVRKFRSHYAETCSYPDWIANNEPDDRKLALQREKRFARQPKISVIVPVYNTPETYLVEMIESVVGQTYGNWELCVANGSGEASAVARVLDDYSARDRRIRINHLVENKGIAENSNEALQLCTGEYVALLDHDDTLAPFALFEIVRAVNSHGEMDLVYSDEDKITADGKARFAPHFKPDWSPDTLRSYNYVGHLAVVKRSTLETVGYFNPDCDGSQDYDLYLRVTEKAEVVVHISKILYHWRSFGHSVADDPGSKAYAYDSAKRALCDHLGRTGMKGKVEDGRVLGTYRIKPVLSRAPLVSIVVPSRDHADDLARCIRSIRDRSTYRDYELLVVENGSVDPKTFDLYQDLSRAGSAKVLTWGQPFNFSAVCNFGARNASGEVLLFLNNDTEVISGDWMESLLQHAVRREVGAVGAKLYYPNETVQHAGIILGIGGVAGHSHKYFPRHSDGYMRRLLVIQNLSAVTGACMMVRRSVFEEVGGFEEDFSLAFNDVDFCIRLREKGYVVIFTPYAELYHHESKTRGYEDSPAKMARFRDETALFQERWGEALLRGDPYYNPNLSLTREDFSLKV